MKTPKKPRVAAVVYIRMTVKEKRRLKEEAKRRGMTEAEMMRAAFAEYVPVTHRVSP